MVKYLLLMLLHIAIGLDATADVTVTIEAPFVQTSTAVFEYYGIETFDSLPVGVTTGYYSTFGAGPSSSLKGTYDSLSIREYGTSGGVGAIGMFPTVWSSSPCTLTLTEFGPKGVNYFGYWLSAFDNGNKLQFYSNETIVFEFTATGVVALIGSRPEYYGNPNYTPREYMTAPFAFLNFFCNDCTFDKIRVVQVGSGGHEFDHHTVGYFQTSSGEVITTSTPAPMTVSIRLGCLLYCIEHR